MARCFAAAYNARTTGERERQTGASKMRVEADDSIDAAIAIRRAELNAMALHDVRHDFESTFGIQANHRDGKDDLIERVLAKQRAQLERFA